MRRVLGLGLLSCVVVIGFSWSWVRGWWILGHGNITEAAARQCPEQMPVFFRAAAKSLGYLAGDPDRWKNRATPFVKNSEEPNHFLDLEDLEGKPLPRDRYKGIAQIIASGKDPARVGLLPYAICEGVDRLTVAFADYRADRDNPAIQMKCIVYAGTLAHYTTDAAMPLHTTIHFDGRRKPDGQVLQKGIHAKIDGFPEKFQISSEEIGRGLEPREIDDLWLHVQGFLLQSHQHIDKCYELDAIGAFERPTEESRKFILERCRAGAQFTLDVWYYAWRKSEKLPPPY